MLNVSASVRCPSPAAWRRATRCETAEPQPLSRGARVRVVQTPEHWPRDHHTRRRAGGGPGRLKAQGPMRALRVVVVDVLGEDRAQVALVHGDDVVETVAPEG